MNKRIISKLVCCLVLLPMFSLGCDDETEDCEKNGSCQVCVKNACGGCGILAHTPGDGCDDGFWSCDDAGGVVCKPSDSSRCADGGCSDLRPQTTLNACGGYDSLPVIPGDECSNGVWECTDDGNITCKPTSDTNPCGGNSKLDLFGKECGVCGTYQCDGKNSLKCVDEGRNECGSCEKLENNPGDPCDNGIWTCDTEGNLICKNKGKQSSNSLCDDSDVGVKCGECGITECKSINEVTIWSGIGILPSDVLRCNDPGRNACGGCSVLEHTPDEPCGECGRYVCKSNDTIECDDPGKNECGGCEPLSACGGCTKLDHQPGEKCDSAESCCTWECDGNGGIRKDEHPKNACGGCGKLDHELSAKCDNGGGKWQCDNSDPSKNSLICACDTHDECGGCNPNSKVGNRCWMCDRGFDGVSEGTYICQDSSLLCKDEHGDVPEKARLFYEEYNDADNGTHEWYGELEYASDTDFFYMENVEDTWLGNMKPEIWIPYDRGFQLCVYILEHRHPSSVDYTCSGTGIDDLYQNRKMTASLTQPAELVLSNGTIYTGFCTLPVSYAEYKYIQIHGFQPMTSNSFSAYISVSSDGTNNDPCRKYYLRYRF